MNKDRKYKGLDFLIHVIKDGTPVVIACQRGATLSRSAETLDTTNKDSGGWQESLAGTRNWGIDTDGLIVANNEAYEYLEEKFMNGEMVQVYLSTPLGKEYQGEAIITDFPLEAPYDDAATYSCSFVGSGKLEIIDSNTTQAGVKFNSMLNSEKEEEIK